MSQLCHNNMLVKQSISS